MKTIVDRIKEKRKELNLTQLQLAKKLSTTERTVNKWEQNEENPDLSLIPTLCEVLGVSTDYLLTGKETKNNVVVMSKQEYCAKKDDIETLDWLISNNQIGEKDQNGDSLDYYIFKYNSLNIIKEIVKRNLIQDIVSMYNHKFLWRWDKDSALKILIQSNDLNKLKEFQITDNNNLFGCGIYTGECIKEIVASKEISNEFLMQYFEGCLDDNLQTNKKPWKEIFKIGIDEAFKIEDVFKLESILSIVLFVNNKSLELLNSSLKNYSDSLTTQYYTNPKHINVCYIEITKEQINKLVELGLVKVALKINNINKILCEKETADNEIFTIATNPNLSSKDKTILKLSHNGIVCLKDLIDLDDYDLYLELINQPLSNNDKMFILFKEEKYRELLKLAHDNDNNSIIESLSQHNFEKIEKELTRIRYDDIKSEKSSVNYDAYNDEKNHHIFFDRDVILFDWILPHNKDRRFFKKACETDKENMDRSLEILVAKRPTEYALQSELLDNGAFVHIRWLEDFYDEKRCFEEKDEVGTQLLRNQLLILSKKEK